MFRRFKYFFVNFLFQTNLEFMYKNFYRYFYWTFFVEIYKKKHLAFYFNFYMYHLKQYLFSVPFEICLI